MKKEEYLDLNRGIILNDLLQQWTNPLYECPKCGGHVCRSNTRGLMLTCNPPIYQDLYRCMDCGFEEYISR